MYVLSRTSPSFKWRLSFEKNGDDDKGKNDRLAKSSLILTKRNCVYFTTLCVPLHCMYLTIVHSLSATKTLIQGYLWLISKSTFNNTRMIFNTRHQSVGFASGRKMAYIKLAIILVCFLAANGSADEVAFDCFRESALSTNGIIPFDGCDGTKTQHSGDHISWHRSLIQ